MHFVVVALVILITVAPQARAGADEELPRGMRAATLDDVSALFMTSELRKEVRSQPPFCAARMQSPYDPRPETAEYAWDAVVVPPRVCRESGEALELSQLVTDPATYYALQPGVIVPRGSYDPILVLEFETSAGLFGVVLTSRCSGVQTYLDNELVGYLDVREPKREQLLKAASLLITLEDEP